jgi:hypothetical protein
MKTPSAFFAMLAVAALGAFAVLRVTEHGAPARPSPPPAPVETLVLAGHAATLALANELAVGTGFAVAAAWPAGLPWAEQAEHARTEREKFPALARRATAVVTLRTAARDDALFAAARAANPRVLELDASAAADQRTPAVRLRAGAEPVGAAFALSLANAAALAERIAADFTALRPVDAPAVAENLRRVRERLFRLRASHEAELAKVAVPEVVAFTPALDALCEEFGLQVVAVFAADEARWAGAERAALTTGLKRAGARVSVHAWPPGPAVRAALEEAGVRPVTLDPLGRAPADGGEYFSRMEANAAALITALAQP